ncbi:peroxisomal biogenesis factor 19 [Cydia pomonella]|uniref:peroxisomal biogenesis factor 19 n=1 Tax=Cydia pomonella TaxID=82600 RepID=UPI002ADD9632|nr:peroxisomal biogenesis factor 19 [Cydia pomonella]
MSDNKDATKKEVDPELDDLLDSALQDMTKKPAAAGEAQEPVWSEEFIKEAAAQFESNMAALLGSFSGVPGEQQEISQEQIAQTFSKMAEAAAAALQPVGAGGAGGAEGGAAPAPDPAKIDEVSAAISQTLQNLSSNSEGLQTPFSDQDLANMFGNFNLGENQEGNMFLPFMQGMMQSLLSKEVLYPSLKELVDKYPAWLEENKGKVPQDDYDRYCRQQELMQQVCAELEPEQETDPEDVKRKRFEVVLELMQKMQDLGQPPTELVGELGAPPPGLAAPDNAQCRLM